MSKANQLATVPHIPIVGKNMVINGSFQRLFRARRGSDTWSQSGPQWITDRWCASIAGAASNLTFTAKGDTVTGDSNKDLKVSLVGSQYAYLGLSSVSTADNKNIMCLQQGIEQNLISRLKWGTPEAKPAVLSFRGLFQPGSQDTNSSITISVAIRTKGTNSTTSPDPMQRTFVTTATLTKTAQRFEIKIPPLTDAAINDISQQSGESGVSLIFVFSAGENALGKATDVSTDKWSLYGNFIHPNQHNKVSSSGDGSQICLGDVQLEEGVVATPFEIIDFTHLRLQCARYFYSVRGPEFIPVIAATPSNGQSTIYSEFRFPTNMRSLPTVLYNLTDADLTNKNSIGPDQWSLVINGLATCSKTSGAFVMSGQVLSYDKWNFYAYGATLNYQPSSLQLGANKYFSFDADIL